MDPRIKILKDKVETHPAEADQQKEESKALIRDAKGFVLVALLDEGVHTVMVKMGGLSAEELLSETFDAVVQLIEIAKGGGGGGEENASGA